MKTLKSFLFLYHPVFGRTIVYMLQAVEYSPAAYLRWLWRAQDFNKVSYRKELVETRPAKILLWAFRIGYIAEILVAAGLLVDGLSRHDYLKVTVAAIILLLAPVVWAFLIILPLAAGDLIIIKPLYGLEIRRSAKIFANHPAAKIAIAGSYGKTTMKEILLTVLAEGKNVKATPANKNVGISHARFAKSLEGDEDILIIEYGEGAPGDVRRFTRRTHPNLGIITGLAPAHLDRYKTLAAAGKDIFSLARFLGDKDTYVNGDSKAAGPFVRKSSVIFSHAGVDNWKVKDVKTSISGLTFTISAKDKTIKVKTKLLGRHLIGSLVLAAYLGGKYGLTDKQIETGIAKVRPFEHRMKPFQLSGGWVIDDTYNGNIEGMKAGLELLKELPAKRKIYITPGLVDQGSEESEIHEELGRTIAKADPDKVVLMKHSVTDAIIKGMGGYKGQLVIEENPLDFYTNLDKFVAAGDLVLMQNDWPDNYN